MISFSRRSDDQSVAGSDARSGAGAKGESPEACENSVVDGARTFAHGEQQQPHGNGDARCGGVGQLVSGDHQRIDERHPPEAVFELGTHQACSSRGPSSCFDDVAVLDSDNKEPVGSENEPASFELERNVVGSEPAEFGPHVGEYEIS